jgi:hypothetical protein
LPHRFGCQVALGSYQKPLDTYQILITRQKAVSDVVAGGPCRSPAEPCLGALVTPSWAKGRAGGPDPGQHGTWLRPGRVRLSWPWTGLRGSGFADTAAGGSRSRCSAHASACSGSCAEPRYPAPALVLALFPRKKGRPVKRLVRWPAKPLPTAAFRAEKGWLLPGEFVHEVVPRFSRRPLPPALALRPAPVCQSPVPVLRLASSIEHRGRADPALPRQWWKQ